MSPITKAPTVRCAVQLFGPQAALAARVQVSVDITPHHTTAADVLGQLGASLPVLRESLATSRLAVDHDFAEAGAVLRGDEALALIGLVGGG